ncbi:o-succinylbenzoate--CoA ligase [Corynebacterium halotolerans]|uniref:O-succinylbenzoic acid--CoA ligase n=1 Tax=Corynebacterium halotolerans YIM 70093 = DSM 44683 TaxID=1121362 RepID=M1MUP6_9CORY|nr:o-succinylbenzoate--CoA ligase [Corynebacterium halotolerans]AGF71464.1 O-succinylbenzoic acid--CoA ligase [Corynebacterium halotolerans YIM 70093 = DSM 44683]
MSRTLDPLVVDPHNPAAILPDLEAAIAGQRTLLPVPAQDRTRTTLLVNSQRAGGPIAGDVALVVATSGSTGTPKGAQLTAANLVSSADATHQFLGGEGQWLLAMPAHHIAGLQVLVRSLIAGIEPLCLDLSDGFGVPDFARAAGELAGTGDRLYTSLAPLQLAKAMDTLEGIEGLRLFDAVLVGGAALNPQVRRAADELGIHVVTTYGSSETAGGCVYDARPIPGAQVEVRDGRIHLGGPMIAAGYRNHPDHEAFAEPGWFATSDVGELVDGRLTVTGRLDAVIDSGGLKLHPEVLEQAMLGVEGVTGACVVGVPHPRLGQAIVAAYSGTASPSEVIEGLDDLPRWQLPKELRQVDTLPLIGPGKVDRQAVMTMFR